MKFSSFFAPRFIASILAGVALLSAPLARAEEGPRQGNSPLEMLMKDMNKAFKVLKNGLESPDAAKKDDYIKAANSLKEAAVKAKDLVPKKFEDMPEEERKAAQEGYRKSMDEFAATAEKLEPLLKEEKWTEAEAVVKELRKSESSGHKAYRKKDD